MSFQCSSWLVDTMEAACQVKEDIAKSFREGDKTLMVHGGANKARRFLEVAVFAEGGHKGGVWLPEGRDGWGWRRRVASFVGPQWWIEGVCDRSLPSSTALPTKLAEARVTRDCSKNRSFAEVLQSKPQSCVEAKNGGDDLRSTVDCNILPTPAWVDVSAGCSKESSFLEAFQSSKDAVGIGGDVLRRAVDYYELEHLGVAAGIAKNIDSIKRRVEELVGFFLLELGWVIAEFHGLPFRKRFQVAFKGFGLGPKPAGHF